MCNFREKWKINLIIWYIIPRGRLLIAPWHGFCLFNEESWLHLSFNRIILKTMPRNFHWFSAKSFGDLCITIMFYDSIMAAEKYSSWIQARELGFYFSNNVAKTCFYGLDISRNIETKCLFHFKAYFHILETVLPKCF